MEGVTVQTESVGGVRKKTYWRTLAFEEAESSNIESLKNFPERFTGRINKAIPCDKCLSSRI